MKSPGVIALVAALACAAVGCQRVLPGVDFERMLNQPRGKAFRGSSYFEDGKLMQLPPEETVPSRSAGVPEPVREGLVNEQYVTSIPVPVTRALLEHGHNRFDLFCATCHGLDGSGESMVAQNMELRKPPALIAEPVRSFPPGRVYRVIADGYGLMPAYGPDLAVDERWAVVAYLRALQRSQSVTLASLPDAVRRQAETALR